MTRGTLLVMAEAQNKTSMETQDKPRYTPNSDDLSGDDAQSKGQKVTHNLDTGEDEPLPDLDDENIMDFGSGSGGGSAGDGGGS